MKYKSLDVGQIEFLYTYMHLPMEKRQHIQSVMELGISKKLSDEEFADFLKLLKDEQDDLKCRY